MPIDIRQPGACAAEWIRSETALARFSGSIGRCAWRAPCKP